MVSGLIQVVAYKYFLPFYGQIHCMNMPHFAYSFHPLMDVWIVSTFDDYKQCCYKHYCALLSHVRLFITPWTHQAPMVFSRQDTGVGLPCSPPGDLPDPRIKPASPAILYPLSHLRSPRISLPQNNSIILVYHSLFILFISWWAFECFYLLPLLIMPLWT